MSLFLLYVYALLHKYLSMWLSKILLFKKSFLCRNELSGGYFFLFYKLITNETPDIFLAGEKKSHIGLSFGCRMLKREKTFGIKDYILRTLSSFCYFYLTFYLVLCSVFSEPWNLPSYFITQLFFFCNLKMFFQFLGIF